MKPSPCPLRSFSDGVQILRYPEGEVSSFGTAALN